MVAIILIIAAIPYPYLLRARVSAQEAAAANQVKTLVTAETAYILAYPSCGYVVMTALGGDGTGPAAAGILDNVIPDRDGYHYDINLSGSGGNCGVISGSNFSIEASPLAGYGTRGTTYSPTQCRERSAEIAVHPVTEQPDTNDCKQSSDQRPTRRKPSLQHPRQRAAHQACRNKDAPPGIPKQSPTRRPERRDSRLDIATDTWAHGMYETFQSAPTSDWLGS